MSWPTSDEFQEALRHDHTPVIQVQILENTEIVADSDVVTLERLDYLQGSVTDDRKATVGRRSVSWDAVDSQRLLQPLAIDNAVYPLIDRDIRIWRGIEGVPANDTDLLVPLATVRLESLSVTHEAGASTYQVGGVDRSKLLSEADWREELTIADGTTPYAATAAILAQVDPGHTYVIDAAPTTKTLDEMTFIPGDDTDPWMAIFKIWESAAQEVFLNQLGRVKTQPYPDPTTAPVAWVFSDGELNTRVDPLTITVDRASVRNGVVVRGTAPWLLFGVHAEAWDTDPTSPTYYDPAHAADSRVGPHPEQIEDPLVSDETEAQTLADSKLPSILGIEEQLEYSSIPNPALEAGDVVTHENSVIGSTTRFMQDQIETPLDIESPQTANARRRRQ